MPKLLRRNGKVVANVVAYESSNTSKPFNMVFKKGSNFNHLPKTAQGKVWVNFFEAKTLKNVNTKKPIFVNHSTARKMELQ
jgi:hypothetical protein